MKLLNISTRNFRLHAESDVTFPAEGVVGIIGSNEAGKSTILEALLWALYGADATRGTKAGLRWHRAPARRGASVSVAFEVGGKEYRIDRTEGGAKLFQAATCIADGTSAVNQYVPTLLGMGLAEFTASFMVKQKDVARIASMQPTERLAFIRSVMGVGKIDAAVKAIRKAKSVLADEMRGLEAGLGAREPLAEAVAAAEAAAAGSAHHVTVWRSRYEAADAERARTLDQLRASEEQSARHERAVRSREDAVTARDAATKEARRLEADMEAQRAAAKRAVAGGAEIAALPGLRAERDALVEAKAQAAAAAEGGGRLLALEREIDGPDGLRDRIADAGRQVASFDPADLARAVTAAEEAQKRYDALRTARRRTLDRHIHTAEAAEVEADRLTKRAVALRALGADAPCPTCTRTLAEHYGEVVAAIEDATRLQRNLVADSRSAADSFREPDDDETEAEVAWGDATATVERMRGAQGDAVAAARQIETLRSTLAGAEAEAARLRERWDGRDAHYDGARHAQVDVEIARLEAMDRALAADRGAAALVDATAARLDEVHQAAVLAESAVVTAAALIEGLAFDTDAHAKTVASAEDARRGLEDARVSLARAQEAEKAAHVALDTAERAIEAYDERAKRLAVARTEHLTHERADGRLAEFRVAMAGMIRPEMEELMSGFVALLTDGRHEAVTLDEDFSATLHESGVPVEVVSGGTEDIAALAMRLAISQMIAERAGHPLSLLVLDEPFGSLDETRRGNVLSLIRRLRGVFRQVVVISHVAETRDAVDHVVELEYDEAAGRTRVLSSPAPVTPHVTEVAAD